MTAVTDRIPVLMYHRVGLTQNDWEARYGITPANFRAQMQKLAAAGYRAITLDDLIAWLDRRKPLRDRSIVITFDDGFLGVKDHAMPVLRELNWPATVFLVSDLIGQRDEWTRASNPSGQTHPLLSADDILAMQTEGFSFHSHTRSHLSLPKLDDGELASQLEGSRSALQRLLGHSVDYIAYPFGHLDERVEAATRAAGYTAAFSTQPGFNRQDVNRFRIRRLDVFGTDTPAMLLRKVKFGSNDGTAGNAMRYYARQFAGRVGLGQATG